MTDLRVFAAAPALLLLLGSAHAADDDFLLGAPAPVGIDGTDAADGLTRIAAGLHSGDAFGPRVRPDGQWVAYGVRESDKGTFKTKYFKRPLTADGMFKSVWPNQHPALESGEGTASFTDLVGFDWSRTEADGFRHNAMVALHKDKREEVLIEGLNVRLSGAGAQTSPAMAPDGTRFVAVSEDKPGGATDLWVCDTVDGAEPIQLTFSGESEIAPSWHPTDQMGRIIYEMRNSLGGDIYEFDFNTFTTKALVKEGISNEIQPTFSPTGKAFAFLSNKDSGDGSRYDLFVSTEAAALPVPVIRDVRRSEKSVGYAWHPTGNFLVAVSNDKSRNFPLVVAATDGSKPPVRLGNTIDNADPAFVRFEDQARLVWVGKSGEGDNYRIVLMKDHPLVGFGNAVGLP